MLQSMARRRTGAERRREVERWRASGESVGKYAARQGYSETTLRKWITTEDSRPSSPAGAPGLVRLVARSTVASASEEALVVEVGAARIRVAASFDPALLRSVVTALSESGRPL